MISYIQLLLKISLMTYNKGKMTIATIVLATFVITMYLTPAFGHEPGYRNDNWFNYNGDPEMCYLESELDNLTVDGSTGNGDDVETAVELSRAEYNTEITGLTIAPEDSNCGFNDIEVGAKGLGFLIMAQTATSVKWSNQDYAETEIDFATGYNWEIDSNECDWFHDKDIEYLANHEIGHALSLADHYGSGSVMNGSCDSAWASVDNDSETALEDRY